MLPKHGKIQCRKCFLSVEGDVATPHPDWRIINDPGAWGGGANPYYLVLGFSKGATQAGIYQTGSFEDIAFAAMRTRLSQALRVVGVLSEEETADEKIRNPNSNIAFGSLIRCSVSRLDKKASAKHRMPSYACTGPLIAKSFSEIPKVISACANAFLTDLPASVRAVLLLSNTDAYVEGCQQLVKRLFPAKFKVLNPMAVHADGRAWVNLAHPSGLNGHFNTWLTSDSGPGLKRKQAQEVLLQVC